MKPILITGASGFIGKNVINKLRYKKNKIVLLNRSKSSIYTNKKEFYINNDLENFSFNDYLAAGSPETILHLAWGGLSNHRNKDHIHKEFPMHFFFLNRLLEYGVKNIIVTGSCLEYGLIEGCLDEKMNCKPVIPYGQAKLKLLKNLINLKSNIDFKLCWLRLFYIYGEDQPGNSIYPSLNKAISTGKSYFEMSHGNQIRDYLSINDLANLIVNITLSKGDYGVINLCSGQPKTINSMIDFWLKEKKTTINLKKGVYNVPDYEPREFWGDRTKLEFILSKLTKV